MFGFVKRKISSLKIQVVVYTGAGKYHCAGGRYDVHGDHLIIWWFNHPFWTFKQAYYWPSLSEFLGRKTPRQLQRIIRSIKLIYQYSSDFHQYSPSISLKLADQSINISRQHNEKMFNVFIEFPKPIIAAVNGPGIGENLRSTNYICLFLKIWANDIWEWVQC